MLSRSGAIAVAVALATLPAAATAKPFVSGLHAIHTLAATAPAAGPGKGDQNPYGVAVVPSTQGKLVKGDVLISNFNNAANQQGTGRSIVEISPGGRLKVFAIVPTPGLTTALVALRSGLVVVGSLPARGGKSSAAKAGALTVLNASGHVVVTIKGGDINGPWDMTAADSGSHATLFVTNVLNGTVGAGGKHVAHGTVVRIVLQTGPGTPKVLSNRPIATGFAEHTDPNALVVGPTGVGLGTNGTLYVADSVGNRIAAIPHALTRMGTAGGGGSTVSKGKALNDPLGLTVAPNGDIVSANGGDGNLVETTPAGRQVATKTLVANGGGDLFGLAVKPGGSGLYFVDDAGSGPAANSLRLLR